MANSTGPGRHLDPPPHGRASGSQGGHAHVGHSHGGPVDDSPQARATRRRAMGLLLAVVVPLALATVVGVVALWPRGDSPADKRLDTSYFAPGGTLLRAKAEKLTTFPCSSAEDPGQGAVQCVRATIQPPGGGKPVQVDLPPNINRAGVQVGDELVLLHLKVGDEQADYYAFVDFVRGAPMGLLAVVYAVVVIAVARLRGLRALIGLGFAYVILATFMLPGLLEGESPLFVGLCGSSAIMFVVLYLAHGFSARTTTALLGTLFGLIVTAVVGIWATGATQLTGLSSEDGMTLLSSTEGLNMSHIVLCGIIIAGLGVLNDVTITQASAVWELHELSPTLPARRLFAGAMRIGRDHIASTVYTIAFAYAGAALPILLLISLYERPILTALTSGELAEEVVRTLVGSIGLVLAIPITTAVAVAVVKAVAPTGPAGQPAPSAPTAAPGTRRNLGDRIQQHLRQPPR
ncbi:YibE/F family protein [Flindersiella endophytica]